MLTLWRSVHPDVERYITAFALGEVWAGDTRPEDRSLICLATSVPWSARTRFACTREGAAERSDTGGGGGDDYSIDDLRRLPGGVAGHGDRQSGHRRTFRSGWVTEPR